MLEVFVDISVPYRDSMVFPSALLYHCESSPDHYYRAVCLSVWINVKSALCLSPVSLRPRSLSAWTRGRRTPRVIAACSVAVSAKTSFPKTRVRTARASLPNPPLPYSCPSMSAPTVNALWKRTSGSPSPTRPQWYVPVTSSSADMTV